MEGIRVWHAVKVSPWSGVSTQVGQGEHGGGSQAGDYDTGYI